MLFVTVWISQIYKELHWPHSFFHCRSSSRNFKRMEKINIGLWFGICRSSSTEEDSDSQWSLTSKAIYPQSLPWKAVIFCFWWYWWPFTRRNRWFPIFKRSSLTYVWGEKGSQLIFPNKSRLPFVHQRNSQQLSILRLMRTVSVSARWKSVYIWRSWQSFWL